MRYLRADTGLESISIPTRIHAPHLDQLWNRRYYAGNFIGGKEISKRAKNFGRENRMWTAVGPRIEAYK